MSPWAILIVLLGTLTVVVLFVMLLWKPLRHATTPADLERFIQDLMDGYCDGSVLVVKHPKSGKFVQFAKYVDGAKTNLHFGFPDANWSRSYFDHVTAILKNEGLQVEIRDTGDEYCPRFAEVDFLPAASDAATIAQKVFSELGIGHEEAVTVTFQGEMDREFLQEMARRFKARKA